MRRRTIHRGGWAFILFLRCRRQLIELVPARFRGVVGIDLLTAHVLVRLVRADQADFASRDKAARGLFRMQLYQYYFIHEGT